MRTLAFDGRMGASGDMLLGALLAAGADQDTLAPVEEALDVEYRVTRVDKARIRATSVDVVLPADDTAPETPSGHTHGDEQPPDHEHQHAEGHGPTRTFAEVVELVDGMALPEAVAGDARATFRLLGEAEAAVHGTDLADTHFHEVGADDAIADVVGTALLIADLNLDRVVTTPVAAGKGSIETSHGTYPVPPPAVIELASEASWSLRGGPVETELLTPTGAALLAHFAEGVDSLPPMRVAETGYGAGGYDFETHPNVLRAILGDAAGGLVRDDVRVLETNLDDVSPELLGGLHDRLADAGALDVTVMPATMKKSRPGHLVKVVVAPEDAHRVARTLAAETGTLGVRDSGVTHRWIAERQFETVELDIAGERHEVTVKVASDDAGDVFDVSAEYDDCAAVADATTCSTREIMARAEDVVRDQLE